MNYSVELWNNYNKAQKTLNFHLQGLKDIINLYTDHYNYQHSFALFLKKTHSSKNQITVFESLYKGFSSFKTDMLNQFNYLSDFLTSLKDDLIKPLTNLYETSLKKLDYNIYEMNSIEKSYKASVQNLENFKKNFHNYAKEAEESKIKAETYKEKNDKNLNASIKKEETKTFDFLKKAKENEKLYVEYIDKTNNLQDDYTEIKKRNLNEIQDIEQEIGENIKDSFRKFIVFQVAYLRNMQYDIKKKSSIFENININKDINKYINNNKTSITQLYKYEYIPYISEFENSLPKEQNTNNNYSYSRYSENVINNVKLFISNIFTKERPNEINPNSIYNKNKLVLDEIKDIITKIFNNKKISNEDKDNINKLILLKKKRRQLLKEINYYNLNNINSSFLNDISFENLSYILKESLKVLQVEKDYESIKLILNFAGGFYHICGEKEKKKIFILNNLLGEKIFMNYEFWKELIKYNIIEEMFNQKSYNLFSNKKEDEEKNKNKIRDIVVNKLNVYINYMIDFKCKFNYMKQIIDEFKNYYELKENEIEKFIEKINEYKKDNNDEEENKKDINFKVEEKDKFGEKNEIKENIIKNEKVDEKKDNKEIIYTKNENIENNIKEEKIEEKNDNNKENNIKEEKFQDKNENKENNIKDGNNENKVKEEKIEEKNDGDKEKNIKNEEKEKSEEKIEKKEKKENKENINIKEEENFEDDDAFGNLNINSFNENLK